MTANGVPADQLLITGFFNRRAAEGADAAEVPDADAADAPSSTQLPASPARTPSPPPLPDPCSWGEALADALLGLTAPAFGAISKDGKGV